MTMYKTLNDAIKYGPEYGEGLTEIWYARSDFFRDASFGAEFLRERGLLPDLNSLETLGSTHVLLGKIIEGDLEKVFEIMQGERWSLEGEARELIVGAGLRHTSMSVGDIVVINGVVSMVDTFGFYDLSYQ